MKLSNILTELNWNPDGVDKSRSYDTSKKIPEILQDKINYLQTELDAAGGEDLGPIGSGVRDAYNQARIMYVNWSQKGSNKRRGNESIVTLLDRRKDYLVGLYKNKKLATAVHNIFARGNTDVFIKDSNQFGDLIPVALFDALAKAADILEKTPISNHQGHNAADFRNNSKIKNWVNAKNSKVATKAVGEGNHIHIAFIDDATFKQLKNNPQEDPVEVGIDSEKEKVPWDKMGTMLPTTTITTTGASGKIAIKPVKDINTTIQNVQDLKSTNLSKKLPTSILGYRQNNDSKEVIILQTALNQLGYDLGSTGPAKDGIDGKFGSKTRYAMREFQSDNDLTVDGFYGPNTRTKMKDMLEDII